MAPAGPLGCSLSRERTGQLGSLWPRQAWIYSANLLPARPAHPSLVLQQLLLCLLTAPAALRDAPSRSPPRKTTHATQS